MTLIERIHTEFEIIKWISANDDFIVLSSCGAVPAKMSFLYCPDTALELPYMLPM